MPFRQQNSFTGGEISPRMEGRVDLKQYGNSVSELENFEPHSYGGIAKSPGFYFVVETKDSSKASRLIEFQRKIGQAYIIEVGDQYLRFVRDGAQITLAATPAAYVAGTTYDQADLVSYSGVNYYSKVGSNIGNQPDISATQWYPLTGDVYEIPTDFLEAEIGDISFCQSVDVMWMVHPDHPPIRLGRFTDTKWTITEEVFVDGPFQSINGTTTAMSASAATGTVTVTANATNGINQNQGFLSTDVGRQIRIYAGSATPDPLWGWGVITAVADSTHVTVDIQDGEFPTANTDLWKMGAFSETTGYPKTVMFFQQRLGYGGTDTEPQGLWLSQTDAFSLFSVSDPIVDSDACSFIMVADQVNDIEWLMAARELAIGTNGGEWTLSGAEGKVVSPSSVKADRNTTVGGSNIRPINIDGVVVFVSRARRALHELAWIFADDGYSSPDLLLLADHLTREAQLVDIAYQGSPDSKVYCVRDDGVMAVLTYKRDQDVVGWSRRTTQGLFESVAVVSSVYRDVPYVIVNRTIGGVTKRFIEWMKADFGDAVEDNVIYLGSMPVYTPGSIPVIDFYATT